MPARRDERTGAVGRRIDRLQGRLRTALSRHRRELRASGEERHDSAEETDSAREALERWTAERL